MKDKQKGKENDLESIRTPPGHPPVLSRFSLVGIWSYEMFQKKTMTTKGG